MGRAHRYCGQAQGARRRRCGDIVDDEQRRDCPQYLCAQRVPAAQGHLLRWRSSTICPYRLRRAALHLPLWRSERGPSYFHHGLLGEPTFLPPRGARAMGTIPSNTRTGSLYEKESSALPAKAHAKPIVNPCRSR